eukprot:CAMPEP_0204552782 /NCGR_PEP_ID=MMETSP0661-20131031/26860_1 /ASSEMBLY_ACC=CAM_ASM_000606 /TAXON_ID=109239 /ORGANISM="Alexandrium margalefi, Strain AMGDE01CS-322" /LENGTH=211 /DNA_ID=CAMNT_0051559805 /DNA_START=89 /DNA_END=724 /DNA_ORIENTATION=+
MGHATDLAECMAGDLRALPPAERREQCGARCAEAWEGVQQIGCVLDATDEALHSGRGLPQGALGAYSERLAWASEMAEGLRRGLQEVESCDADGESLDRPYRALSRCLAECEASRRRLGEAIERLELAAACGAGPPARKVDAAKAAAAHRHVQDFINDMLAEEAALLLRSMAWLLRPVAGLFDLLAPTLHPSIGAAGGGLVARHWEAVGGT